MTQRHCQGTDRETEAHRGEETRVRSQAPRCLLRPSPLCPQPTQQVSGKGRGGRGPQGEGEKGRQGSRSPSSAAAGPPSRGDPPEMEQPHSPQLTTPPHKSTPTPPALRPLSSLPAPLPLGPIGHHLLSKGRPPQCAGNHPIVTGPGTTVGIYFLRPRRPRHMCPQGPSASWIGTGCMDGAGRQAVLRS